jgi:hypothetical protein
VDGVRRVRVGVGVTTRGGHHVNHFKLRAECDSDVDAFADALRDASIQVRSWAISKAPGLPDIILSFETDVSVDVLRGILRTMVDGEVMYETIGGAHRWNGVRRDPEQ